MMQGKCIIPSFVVQRIQNKIESIWIRNSKKLLWEREEILTWYFPQEMDPGDMDEQQMKKRPLWKRYNKVTIVTNLPSVTMSLCDTCGKATTRSHNCPKPHMPSFSFFLPLNKITVDIS